jgi:hypothetical protein
VTCLGWRWSRRRQGWSGRRWGRDGDREDGAGQGGRAGNGEDHTGLGRGSGLEAGRWQSSCAGARPGVGGAPTRAGPGWWRRGPCGARQGRGQWRRRGWQWRRRFKIFVKWAMQWAWGENPCYGMNQYVHRLGHYVHRLTDEYMWQYIHRLTDEHTSLYSSVPITFVGFYSEEDIWVIFLDTEENMLFSYSEYTVYHFLLHGLLMWPTQIASNSSTLLSPLISGLSFINHRAHKNGILLLTREIFKGGL